MSLMEKREMSPEQIAANQANGRKSHGPVTPEGLERAQTASLKHGFRSRFFQEAIGLHGEDADEFESVQEGLVRYWEPQDPLREALVKRLATLVWRLERTDRQRESFGVRHARAEQVKHAAEADAQYPELETVIVQLGRARQALRRRDWPALREEIDKWRQCAIDSEPEAGIDSAMQRLAAEPPLSAEEQDAVVADLDGQIGDAICSSQELRTVWAQEAGEKAAERWLAEVESSVNPEALERSEKFIAAEVDRTVRLLRQLRGMDGAPEPRVREKIENVRPSHDVVENKG